MKTLVSRSVAVSILLWAGSALAQPAPSPTPSPPTPQPEEEAPSGEQSEDLENKSPGEPAEGATVEEAAENTVEEGTEAAEESMEDLPEEEPAFYELRVHIISTTNQYDDMRFDVFSVADREIVGRGQGANEAVGEPVATFELDPGIYKIVKAGESFDTVIDFATVVVDYDTDFLIVVDADTGAFRGSGIVTDELPQGRSIAGIRFALNVGGSLWLNQRRGVVGTTNGTTATLGVFGNFGMVYDKGAHLVTVNSNAQLNLQDLPTQGVFANGDYLEASALYSYKLNNEFIGPYARADVKTRLFPGYLYLANEEGSTGQVEVNRLDGSVENLTFGSEAHPDDLRLEIAQPFAPLILQEEIGANVKAVDMDLRLLEMTVGTRFGWGFRQGFTRGLLVVQGEERGSPVRINEVDNYTTTGPIAGATANVTFARWLFGQGTISSMVPVQNRSQAGDEFASQLLVDASGTAGLKFPALTSMLHASFDYTFRLRRDGYLSGKTMFDQVVMARMSLQLF